MTTRKTPEAKKDESKGKQAKSASQAPLQGNLSDRLVSIHGTRGPEAPQAWPPTFEEYSKRIDPRTTLF